MSLLETPAVTPPAAVEVAAPSHDDVPRAELEGAMRRRTPLWKPLGVFVLLALAGAGVVALGAIPRAQRSEAAAAASERQVAAGKRVQLAPVKAIPATRVIALPASLQPEMQAAVFAQATGYLADRRVDIGSRVKAGDVLARVDIPLVEQDLHRAEAAQLEAEADREKTRKNLELARTTLERWKSVQANAVARQDLDERQAAYDALVAAVASADATVASRKADVQRLAREKSFGEVVAPFDGVISSRSAEVGDYVTTGSGSMALFSIVRTDTLRASVDVPQAYAYSVKEGQRAKIAVRQIPGKVFDGVVARTSGALDERTRSLRAEVQVPNETGELLSGTFATVQFDVPTPEAGVIVPGSALLVRAEGPRVAVVDAESKIQYLPVKVRRDLGTEVEIAEGLEGQRFVVVNMADEIPAGTKVEGVQPPAPPAPAEKK